MPESFGSSRPHPGKLFRLKDAAEGGYLIKVHCSLCRTTTYYLASDLVKLANPERPAHAIPFPCSRCETTEFMSAKPRFPASGGGQH